MIDLIIALVSPFFLSLGVAQNDINSYAEALGGYLYAILILFLLAAAVMVGAHWMAKKGSRHVIRWTAAVAWVLSLALIVNIVCFGPMYNNLAPILNGRGEVSEEAVAASKEVIQEVGEEGFVLVKNEGLLPLTDTDSLNIFGWASTSPIYGGLGSGASDSTGCVDLLTALQTAGFETNDSLSQMYRDYCDERPDRVDSPVGDWTMKDWTLPEPTADYYTEDLMAEAEAFSDVAVIVLGRNGGEGRDEPTDMYAAIHNTYDPRNEGIGQPSYDFFDAIYFNNSEEYDDFDPGESYLELSNTEEAMIETVCQSFENVVVIINANNVMELGWVDEYDAIKSVILAPGTGNTGMLGLGEILSGGVNPSGKTVDTYVYDLFDTPTAHNFGSFLYGNTEDLQEEILAGDETYAGVMAFINYVEGIYVGYKFYETAAEEGFLDYEEKVQYPFGYGLSYTTFTQTISDFVDHGDSVTVEVTVTNTGDVAGKDVVELYYTPPYYNGGIEKASVNLLDFGKTGLLEPSASETIVFEVAKENLAAYDSSCIKTAQGGYILEAGDYVLSIRSDSHTVLDSVSFAVEADIDYSETGRSDDQTAPVNRFEDYSAGTVTYLSRADHFANYGEATAAPAESAYLMDDETRESVKAASTTFYDPTLYNDPDDVMPTTGADNGVVVADLIGKSYDDPLWDSLLDQLTVEDMSDMVNLGGFQTVAVESIGKVGTQDSDGTCGLNDWYIQVYGTAYPVEVLIAQTWNKELAYRVGVVMGAEYASAGIFGWYGPAMNLHRSAFGGRNFEYYSEDGILSGYIASAEVNGAATEGVYAYIKHFALNEQEGNRCTFLLTYCNEQAIRENYLKPFEICVKSNVTLGGAENGYPLAVMSSFVFIGDVYSGANPDLLNSVLRDEWGFQGFVLTDWNGSYGYQTTDNCVRNGNDAMLGFNWYESNLLTDLESPTLVTALRAACKNILYTVANSGNYTVLNQDGGMDQMTRMFLAADLTIAVLALGVEAVVVLRWLKKHKQATGALSK